MRFRTMRSLYLSGVELVRDCCTEKSLREMGHWLPFLLLPIDAAAVYALSRHNGVSLYTSLTLLTRTTLLLLITQTHLLSTPVEPTVKREKWRRSYLVRRYSGRSLRSRLPEIAWLANYLCAVGHLLWTSENSEVIRHWSPWLAFAWELSTMSGLYAVWKLSHRPTTVEATLEKEKGEGEREEGGELRRDSSDSDGSGDNEDEEGEGEEATSGTLDHVKMLVDYALPYWRRCIGGSALLLASSWASLCYTHYHTTLISDITGSRLFAQASAMMVLSGLSSRLVSVLERRIFGHVTRSITLRVRKDLFHSMVQQEVAYFERTGSGAASSRLGRRCEKVGEALVENVSELAESGCMLVGCFVSMVAMNWRLSLVPLAITPLMIFISEFESTQWEEWYDKQLEMEEKTEGVVSEAFSDVRTMRAFAAERQAEGSYCRQLDENFHLEQERTCSWTHNAREWMWSVSENALLIITLLYGGYLASTGRMDPAGILAFHLYRERFSLHSIQLHNHYTYIVDAVRSTRKVFHGLRRQPQFPLGGSATFPASAVAGHIRFHNVSFTYPSRPSSPVLNNISFEVRPGETVALVGPSGAGKSTIVALLEHFYEPTRGEITLDGVSVGDFQHEFYHRHVAIVPQEPTLYSGTVKENILYGYGGCGNGEGEVELHTRMVVAAKEANIHDFIIECKEGYSTKCGERGLQLSGGQKQRIAIARALVRNPRVLLLDEATSAMDSETEFHIRTAIERCSNGRTVLVIAHRLSTVERANRILVMEKGRIVQEGSHSELLQDRAGSYSRMVERQRL